MAVEDSVRGLVEDEDYAPVVEENHTFECSECHKKVTAKTTSYVCTGVDLGVVVELPNGEQAIYKNGFDAEGKPLIIQGKVCQVGSDGKAYKADVDPTTIPGGHKPTLVKNPSYYTEGGEE